MSMVEKQTVISINYLKKLVKLNVRDQFTQQRKVDVMASDKCFLYKYKNYLTILPDKFRYAVTKFRICNTKLSIEQGRYNNIY